MQEGDGAVPTNSMGASPQVEQVRAALHREFDGLIDESDVTHPDPGERERKFLSRALAALAARKLSGHDSREVVEYLVDGDKDRGIDAVVPLNGGLHIYFIQSKWNKNGTAGFGSGDAQAFFQGFRLLEEQKFDRFNSNLRRYAEQIKKAPWDPRSRVTFLIVLMGEGKLHPTVQQDLVDFEEGLNHLNPSFITHEVWGAERLWQIIRDDLAAPKVKLEAPMDQWFHLGEPYNGYQGRVCAADVAEWFDRNRERLFDQNIRQPLGLTEVNQGLVQTLIGAPETFWYRNNGMTILCDKIDAHFWNRAAYGPVKLVLHGASVVNGAQTAMATYEAFRKDPEAVARAYVGIKVISTNGCPPDFAAMVTRATNTQNHVGRRELVVALDQVQSDIRLDFLLTLEKEYVFRTGEKEPTAEMGCTVVEAAVALACAHTNPDLAVRAKLSTELLWEESTYKTLFGGQPSARLIWRAVQVNRAVRTVLYAGKVSREGRAQTIADHGEALLVHIVLQNIGLDELESSGEEDWHRIVARVPDLTNRALTWLINHIDQAYGPTSLITSTLTNPERYRYLAEAVLMALASGLDSPELPPAYKASPEPRRPRRPNAVPTLIDAGRIEDGTTIVLLPGPKSEVEAIGAWLAEDEKRGTATWVNDRRKPLLWAVDGQRYSPSGLTTHIWQEAGWKDHPVSVKGPSRWGIPGKGSLWDLALEIMAEREEAEE